MLHENPSVYSASSLYYCEFCLYQLEIIVEVPYSMMLTFVLRDNHIIRGLLTPAL